MFAIFKKEVTSFFTSSLGFLMISLFLVLTGLFLWVFKNSFNIFDYGFSDLSKFFLLAPWVFLLLIPAITMKSLAEEQKLGTLELLLIKPISPLQIVLGKFLGALSLVVIAVIPTFTYLFAIHNLGIVEGNFDMGVAIGSFFALFFLMATYTAIGIFASSLTSNQIVSFITAIAISFFVFYGFEAIATLFSNGQTQLLIGKLGAKAHFDSSAKGILDTRDMIYFTTLTGFFIFLAHLKIKNLVA